MGTEGDVHFMVLVYIPGMSIFDMVKSEGYGPLRVTDAARLFVKVVDGLEAAHRAGLVRRDIKRSNIMITPDGNAKIHDLGLARALGEERGITRANIVLGTLDCASPEQLSDASKADVRSDLYSVGCSLYFTASGRPPFEGGDMIKKIFGQWLDDPEPLEKIVRGVPAAFAALVRKLMAKKPEERYQTCAELRANLVRWTDPARLRAILGGEAEAARSFHPPLSRLRTRTCGSSRWPTIPARASSRSATSATPSHPTPPATALPCPRFPPRCGREPPPTRGNPESAATPAGCSTSP